MLRWWSISPTLRRECRGLCRDGVGFRTFLARWFRDVSVCGGEQTECVSRCVLGGAAGMEVISMSCARVDVMDDDVTGGLTRLARTHLCSPQFSLLCRV